MPVLNFICFFYLFILILATPHAFAQAQTSDQASQAQLDQAAALAYTRGIAALRTERYEQAIEFLKQAVQIKPLDAQFRFALATAYGHTDKRLNQWFQLRQVVRLNPKLEAARDDFLQMWRVASDKGFLNIGTSMEEIKAALGEADREQADPVNERNALWQYGFMGVQFIDAKLAFTIDLRREFTPGADTKGALSLAFGDLDWRLKTEHLGLGGSVLEYGPAVADIYQQKLVIEYLVDLPTTLTVRDILNQAIERIEKKEKTEWKTLYEKEKENNSNVIFEWRDTSTNPRHEITRLFSRGDDDLVVRMTYTAYVADLAEDQRTQWLKIIARAGILTSAGN